MENVRKLETMAASWFKDVPHMPDGGRKWLAENIWWIVLIGLILGFIGIWLLVLALFFASAVLISFGGVVGAAISGAIWIVSFIGFLLSIVELVLLALAISPLKAQQKKGWTLLFIVLLINVASLVVSFLFKYNFFELVWGLLISAIGAYFLFEIRDRFRAGQSQQVIKKPAQRKSA